MVDVHDRTAALPIVGAVVALVVLVFPSSGGSAKPDAAPPSAASAVPSALPTVEPTVVPATAPPPAATEAVLRIAVDNSSAGYLVGPNQYAHKKGFASADDEVNVTLTINVSGNSSACFVSYSFFGGSSDGTAAQGKGCRIGTNNGLLVNGG
jgi:hypothetical protein